MIPKLNLSRIEFLLGVAGLLTICSIILLIIDFALKDEIIATITEADNERIRLSQETARLNGVSVHDPSHHVVHDSPVMATEISDTTGEEGVVPSKTRRFKRPHH
jgi:hypothetical protein